MSSMNESMTEELTIKGDTVVNSLGQSIKTLIKNSDSHEVRK